MVIIHGGWLMRLGHWLYHLEHERSFDEIHSILMVVIFTASLVLQEHVLDVCVALLTSILN